MTILNQSITPNGQPVFPAKSSSGQDASQHVPMALPLHGSCPRKSFHLLKNTSLTIAGGVPSQREPMHRDTEHCMKKQGQNSMVGSIDDICKFSHLLNNEDHLNLLDQPITGVAQDDNCKTRGSDVEFEPCSLSFLRSQLEKEKFNLINDVMGKHDLFSLEPNGTLVVAVSSAVKLEHEQIDQIARKMQRLTGFRNLRLENTVDPSLIAGFVISYGTEGLHVIDLSVKGQLADLAALVESSDQRISNHSQTWSFPISEG